MIHPFKIYSYQLYRVLLAVDFIEARRFTEERRTSDDRDVLALGCSPTKKKKKGSWLWRRLDDLLWMIEYNRLTLFNVVMFALLNAIVLFNSILSVCFIVADNKERDPQTGQFVNSCLRFTESIYWFDTMAKCDPSGGQHRMMLMMCLPLILNLARLLMSKFATARDNRHKYSQLDIIQMNVAQIDVFAVKTIGDLVSFLLACSRHKCELKCRNILRSSRGKSIKLHTEQSMKMQHIDWLYFRNMISFNDCYSRDSHLSKYLVKPKPIAPQCHEISNHPRSLGQRLWTVLSRSDENRHLFVQKPYHRLDPCAFSRLSYIYFGTILTLLFVLPFNIGVFYFPVLLRNGLDREHLLSTIVGAYIASFSDPLYLLEYIELCSYITSVAVLETQYASVVHCSVVASSRAKVVEEMLRVELMFYYSKLKAFHKYIEENNLFIDELNHAVAVLAAHNQLELPSRDKILPAKKRSLRNVESILRQFRRLQLEEAQIVEFNENIAHLLRLIRVLESEQRDLRAHFTWSLSVSVVVGTLGLSVASSLLYDCETLHQILVVCIPALTLLLPIVFCLVMSATSEGSYVRIIRAITPLMVNELGLLDECVVRDLQRVYSHLSVIENRSFMILGCVPLTFGSLTPVSTSVSSIQAQIHTT